jgi:hypothetical protein
MPVFSIFSAVSSLSEENQLSFRNIRKDFTILSLSNNIPEFIQPDVKFLYPALKFCTEKQYTWYSKIYSDREAAKITWIVVVHQVLSDS